MFVKINNKPTYSLLYSPHEKISRDRNTDYLETLAIKCLVNMWCTEAPQPSKNRDVGGVNTPTQSWDLQTNFICFSVFNCALHLYFRIRIN